MEKRISYFFIVYFLIGVVFAIFFAYYYRWPVLSYLSPGFWMVSFSWPYQAIGLVKDLLIFGLAGKPIQ